MRLTKNWIADFIFNSNGIEGYFTPKKHIRDIIDKKYPGRSPLILNQIAAVAYVKEHRKEVPTINMIRELHKILLDNVDSCAGKIRNAPVYIGRREGPDHKTLHYLLDTWIQTWGKKPRTSWTNKKTAMFRHYEYERIHPFFDGNGRSGRLLLLWDCLHHRTDMEMPLCENKARYAYYDAIDNYVMNDREKYMCDWK